jgi:hypothetical protein
VDRLWLDDRSKFGPGIGPHQLYVLHAHQAGPDDRQP